MATASLRFAPIDLHQHAAHCVAFREDTFQLALGSTALFHGADGQGAARYLAWLRKQHQALPGSLLHAWQGEQLVGQLEMSLPEPGLGYVHLFYLVPSYRQCGLGQHLHDHALGFFQRQGCTRLALCAAPGNLPALAFYQRNGWRNVGPRPEAPGVERYERDMH